MFYITIGIGVGILISIFPAYLYAKNKSSGAYAKGYDKGWKDRGKLRTAVEYARGYRDGLKDRGEEIVLQ